MKADRATVVRLLKTARGQMDGVLKMVEEDRYCMDIATQLMATQSVLRKAEREILKAHMACCVKDALLSDNGEEKLEELLTLIDQVTR